MAYSTDQELLRIIGESTDIMDHSSISGPDLTFVRLRGSLEIAISELQSIHEKASEPKPSFEFRTAISQVWIGIAYFYNAFLEHEKAPETEKIHILKNQALQSHSYFLAGVNSLLLAIEDSDNGTTVGEFGI